MKRLLDDPLVEAVAVIVGVVMLVGLGIAMAVVGGMWIGEVR